MEETKDLIEQVKALTIKTADDYKVGGEMLKGIKALQKEICAALDPVVEKAHAAHKEAVAMKKAQLAPAEAAEAVLKKALLAYEAEERRKADEERRRLEAEARKKAEEEALARAALLEEMGETEAAEAVLDKPLEVAPVVMEAPAKVEGLSSRENWRAEVVDLRALALAVGMGQLPVEYIGANLPELNKVARAMKQAMNVPGVKAVAEMVMGARA